MFLTYDTQVVALLGGSGTRLGSDKSGVPKSMTDVHGKPFFQYQLELMRWHGFRDFLFLTGFRGDAVRKHFGSGDKFGVRIRYSEDGDMPLGTAGALKKAAPLLNDDFLLIYGDSYMDADYSELIYYYRQARLSGKETLLAVYRNMNKYDKSNILFKDGSLIAYDKAGTAQGMEHIDYGVSIMHKKVTQEIPGGASDLAGLYHCLIESARAAGHEVRTRFYEIGTPASLDEFRRFMSARIFAKRKAIFLDRDGTLNETVMNPQAGEKDSPFRPEDVRLIPHVVDALKIFRSLGYLLVVVTNQPAAAKAKTTLGDLYAVNNRLRDLLAKEDIMFDDLLMCPHHPVGSPATGEPYLIRECTCRKPHTGLFLKGIEKFNITAAQSYAVGDREVDIAAGEAAGIKGILLGKDYKDLFAFSKYLQKESELR